MKTNNEKDIDNILNEYAETVGKTSDKSRDLGKLYAKKSEKREYRRPIARSWVHVCVAAMLVCIILVSIPVYEGKIHGFLDATMHFTGTSSSSGNNGGFFDSISGWLDSLGGHKGDQGDKDGTKEDQGAQGDEGDSGDKGDSSTVCSDTVLLNESFFADRTVPRIECQSVDIKKLDLADAAAGVGLDRFRVNLWILDGEYLYASFNYVSENVVLGDYKSYKSFADKKELCGISVSYSVKETSSDLFLYSMYFNESGADCYIDIYSSVQKDIDEVLTDFFE